MSLLEEARAFGELLHQGWRPRRTIIYAAWDGEEPGLLGSTEWAETHAEELDRHAAVYINSDVNGRGVLSMGGSGTLEHSSTRWRGTSPIPRPGSPRGSVCNSD